MFGTVYQFIPTSFILHQVCLRAMSMSARAMKHKQTGNTHYSMGRYGEALAAYALASEACTPAADAASTLFPPTFRVADPSQLSR